ncbi:MAG TPA: amino acid adenylation domain-containing protein, partial [Ktedonobacteraceae bacterium]
LVKRNTTHFSYPEDQCIHQLIEEQARRTPDAIAIVFENMHLTYQALDRYASHMAVQLQRKDIGPEKLVGLYVERSLEMIIGLLAILKAGGAYVPLDPGYPWERLDFMIRDASIQIVLTQRHLAETLPLYDLDIVLVEPPLSAEEPCDEPAPEAGLHIHPGNLAYVIYTSGSTGTPKGVQIPHAAAVNLLCSMRLQLDITDQDIFFSVTTLSFDIAYLEIFLPLMVGAKLVLASRVAASGFRLEPALATSSATMMQATPATWKMLLGTKWHNTSLRAILCGGEALTPDLAAALHKQDASLWNLYGPTETTIWSMAAHIEDATVSLGQPIGNTVIYVLDSSSLQPVPIGTPGELYIGGRGLSRGYRNRADLTAERFIPHPFSTEPGARLYRTGDIACYTTDRKLVYRDRIDNQVKLHGFRIELGEIEAVLNQHRRVHQSIVAVQELSSGEKLLVAYVVSAEQPSTQELRSFLQKRLPNYMLPTIFVFLEALPLTPNGKVNRRALPIPQAPP